MNTSWKITAERQRRTVAAHVAALGGEKRDGVDSERRRAVVSALKGTLERRQVSTLPFEVREMTSTGKLRFNGYAALFDDRIEIGDVERNGFYEILRPGAFKRCLKGQGFDCILNVGHGDSASGLPIARVSAGTLRLREDATGLLCEADLDPEDPDVQLVSVKMRNGSLDGQMSYAFRCGQDKFDEETRTRELLEVSIAKGDVSIVTYGANSNTSSSLRSRTPPRVETHAEHVARLRIRHQEQAVRVMALRKKGWDR